MVLSVESIHITPDEIEELDRTNPYNVVGAFIQTITEFNPEDPEPFFEKLQILQGSLQPISELMKQNVEDRMNQNSKYEYIGKSYFVGSKPENEYEPMLNLNKNIEGLEKFIEPFSPQSLSDSSLGIPEIETEE